MGFFPSDYEIECLNHELYLKGKHRIDFEDILKLFVNHAPVMLNSHQYDNNQHDLENAVNAIMNISSDSTMTKKNLIRILTETAEKVCTKDAESYVEHLFQGPESVNDE